MRPFVPVAAAALAERLRAEILPELTGFRAGNVAMTAAMFDMIGEEWDRAAARLFEENAAIRALLVRGGVRPPQDTDDDLRISALDANNDALRQALITLHADIEQRDDADARALEATIWDELRRSVERRKISSANF